jgi:hypothetical protein
MKDVTIHAAVDDDDKALASVPGVEDDLAEVGSEAQGVDLDTQGG